RRHWTYAAHHHHLLSAYTARDGHRGGGGGGDRGASGMSLGAPCPIKVKPAARGDGLITKHLFHRSTLYPKSGHVSTVHDIPKFLNGSDPPASHRARRHPKPIGYLLLRPLLHTIPSDQHLLRPLAKLAKSPVKINALQEVVAHPRIRTPKPLALATLIADE